MSDTQTLFYFFFAHLHYKEDEAVVKVSVPVTDILLSCCQGSKVRTPILVSVHIPIKCTTQLHLSRRKM
jgi:hypothetical protein